MSESTYVAAALGVVVAITFALRAVPFLARTAIKDSPLLAELGRWMPLGAVLILACYSVSLIDLTDGQKSAGPVAGVVVTLCVHFWRRNAALSIVAGTAACLVVTNVL